MPTYVVFFCEDLDNKFQGVLPVCIVSAKAEHMSLFPLTLNSFHCWFLQFCSRNLQNKSGVLKFNLWPPLFFSNLDTPFAQISLLISVLVLFFPFLCLLKGALN